MTPLPFRFYAWAAWTASVGLLMYSDVPIGALILVLFGPYTLTVLEDLGRE